MRKMSRNERKSAKNASKNSSSSSIDQSPLGLEEPEKTPIFACETEKEGLLSSDLQRTPSRKFVDRNMDVLPPLPNTVVNSPYDHSPDMSTLKNQLTTDCDKAFSDRLLLKEPLGVGAFGRVYRAYDSALRCDVAVKFINVDVPEFDLEEIAGELKALRSCDSPYVTKLYDVSVQKKDVVMVLELMTGGTLYDLLSISTLSRPQLAVAGHAMFKGLSYIHQSGLVHRDIKSDNLLLSVDGQVKIGDLGIAAEAIGSVTRKTFAGSLFWIAPEILKEQEYGQKVDIWSAGCTIHEMVTGSPPFYGSPFDLVYSSLENGIPPPALDNSHDSDVQQVFAACTRVAASERPTADEVLEFNIFRDIPDRNVLLPLIESAMAQKSQQKPIIPTPFTTSPEPRSYDSTVFEYSPLGRSDADEGVKKILYPSPVACKPAPRGVVASGMEHAPTPVRACSRVAVDSSHFMAADDLPGDSDDVNPRCEEGVDSRNCFLTLWNLLIDCIRSKKIVENDASRLIPDSSMGYVPEQDHLEGKTSKNEYGGNWGGANGSDDRLLDKPQCDAFSKAV